MLPPSHGSRPVDPGTACQKLTKDASVPRDVQQQDPGATDAACMEDFGASSIPVAMFQSDPPVPSLALNMHLKQRKARREFVEKLVSTMELKDVKNALKLIFPSSAKSYLGHPAGTAALPSTGNQEFVICCIIMHWMLFAVSSPK